jgi:competence protein ComEC
MGPVTAELDPGQLNQSTRVASEKQTGAKPLVMVASLLVIGLVLGERFFYFPLSVLGLLVVSLSVWRWFRVSSIPRGLILIPLLFGLVYYQVVVRYDSASDLSAYFDQDGTIFEGRLEDPVRHYPDRAVGVLAIDKIFLYGEEHSVRGRVRLGLNWPEPGFLPGDLLRVEARLRSPLGFKNPGEFDYAEYLHRDGIRAVSTVSHPERVASPGKAPGIVMRTIAVWREKIRTAISNSLGTRESAILLAMIIGESGYLTNEIRDDFMASGTTHILSISGSHLGLVAFIVFLLVRRGLRLLPESVFLRLTVRLTPSQIAASATCFPVVFYSMLAGPQAATIRSLIMILLYLLAVVLQREDDLLNALAFAAVLTLLWQPQAIMDISFQLSYGSVLAMGLFLRWWKNHSEEELESTPGSRILRSLSLALLLTLTTTVWTAPLVAYHFHQLAWVGLVANLVVIPIAGFLIVPLGLISSVLVLFLNLDRLPFVWINQHSLAVFDGLVRLFSRLPAAEVHLPSPPVFFIVSFYLLLFFLFRSGRIKTPRILAGALVLAFVFLAAWGAMPRFPNHTLRVSYLDVGQGDSALVEFPEGRVMVIDGGGAFGDFDLGRIVVAPYLWNRRIHRIDYLVATHPQQDHLGGLSYLLKKFDIGEVWTNGTRRDTLTYQTFSQELDRKGLKEREMHSSTDPLHIGGCRVGVLNPYRPSDNETSDYRSKADNDRSVVLRIEEGDNSFLFAGDIETGAERMIAALEGEIKSTVLKVPHHGSRGALDEAFLSRVRPEIAVISVGAHNAYGHPAPEVLEAYGRLGAELYRTDREGAIQIRSDGKRLSVQTDRKLRLAPVEFQPDFILGEWENLKKAWTVF